MVGENPGGMLPDGSILFFYDEVCSGKRWFERKFTELGVSRMIPDILGYLGNWAY